MDQSSAILKEVKNELYLIQRENDSSNNCKMSLADIFHFHGNEATLQATFYHECRIKQIPCVLQVRSQYGRLDAIIEVNDKFHVIELKFLYNQESLKGFSDQLNRYSKTKYPVIILTNYNSIPEFLVALENTNLNNKIYYFDEDSKSLKLYSYPQ